MNKKEALEKKIKERKEIDDAKRKQEIDFLNYQSQHLESFLKSITPDLKWGKETKKKDWLSSTWQFRLTQYSDHHKY